MSSSLIRWSGLAAMLGGVLFAAAAIVIASMPRGCIGNDCAFEEMRDTGAAGGLQMLALLLVVAGEQPGWPSVPVTPVASEGWNGQVCSSARSGSRC